MVSKFKLNKLLLLLTAFIPFCSIKSMENYQEKLATPLAAGAAVSGATLCALLGYYYRALNEVNNCKTNEKNKHQCAGEFPLSLPDMNSKKYLDQIKERPGHCKAYEANLGCDERKNFTTFTPDQYPSLPIYLENQYYYNKNGRPRYGMRGTLLCNEHCAPRFSRLKNIIDPAVVLTGIAFIVTAAGSAYLKLKKSN